MRRIPTIFASLAPIVLAGALLGGTARSTRADDGNDVTQDASDDDDDSNDAAVQAAHAGQDAQRAARDEAREAVRHARDEARDELRRAREQVTHDNSIPPAIRAMVLKRLDQAERIVNKHLDAAASTDDLGAMTAELSQMGNEIGQSMGGMSDDMRRMQKDMAKMGRDMARKWAGKGWKVYIDGNGGASVASADDDNDSSDDDGVNVHVDVVPVPSVPAVPVPPVPPVPPMPPMPGAHADVDMSDLDVNVNLDDLQLSQPQRDQLQQILAQEEQASDQADQQINGLSDGLRSLLQDPNASESDVGRMVDQINSAEGAYRKERIVAWMRVRKVLDQQQRDALMRATHHHRHHH
jgi:hypothetical protein